MLWKNNFSEINLIFNTPITFDLYLDETKQLVSDYSFQMRIPTITEVYTDQNLMMVASLLNTDVEDLQQQFPMITNLSNHFQLFNTLLLISQRNEGLFRYINKLLLVFQNLGIPIGLSENKIYFLIDNQHEVTFDLFNDIQRILMVCLGLKKASDYALIDPTYAEMQKKIDRIKKQNKSAKEVSKDNVFESIITLTYEFGLSIEEIKNLNTFQMNTYLSYVGKSIRYKASLIAVGNGLSKKIKYITEKGK